MSLLKSAALASALAVCVPVAALADPLVLTSSNFTDGGKLPVKHAGALKTNPNCVGENVSPALAWNDPPEGTKSFAFVIYDPDGGRGLGVYHWVAYGIAPDRRSFAEGDVGQSSDKFVGGKNTAGLNFYLGPCPPANTGIHHYNFSLIATDLEPNALEPGLTRDELVVKLKGHTKGVGTMVALFGR